MNIREHKSEMNFLSFWVWHQSRSYAASTTNQIWLRQQA